MLQQSYLVTCHNPCHVPMIEFSHDVVIIIHLKVLYGPYTIAILDMAKVKIEQVVK